MVSETMPAVRHFALCSPPCAADVRSIPDMRESASDEFGSTCVDVRKCEVGSGADLKYQTLGFAEQAHATLSLNQAGRRSERGV
jgi:hypothetical protein